MTRKLSAIHESIYQCRGFMWNKIISKLLFQPSSTSVWNNFIPCSAWKLARNYFKIISRGLLQLV